MKTGAKKIKVVLDTNVLVSGLNFEGNENRILECAVEARVDYLITEDTKHLQPLKKIEEIPILTPTQFLNII